MSNYSWNYKSSGVCEQGFSLSVQVMGKSWPNSVASNYQYLFVWANLCILFILHFKPSFSNWAETELKRNTGIRKTIQHWHYHTQTVGASSPLVLIVLRQCVYVLATIRRIHESLRDELGTQQENSATKLVDICRSFCNSSAWQSELGFVLGMCWLNSSGKRFFSRKWVSSLV
jgi:uncharacterized membrane protein